MRERGTQSRRERPVGPDRVRRPVGRPSSAPRPPSDNTRFWQALAIIAIVVATAGWTTAAMLATREPAAGDAVPTDDAGDSFDIPSVEPIVLTHDFPALEAQLPTEVNGTTLETESWTGDKILADDPWSIAMTTYLTGIGRSPEDLKIAQSVDAAQTIDVVARLFRIDGIAPADLQAAMIAGWKVDLPDLIVSQVSIGGKAVTKGDFGEGGVNSYWYISGDMVYDIEATDETIATATLAAVPSPGAGGSPSATGSASPSGISSPSASPS